MTYNYDRPRADPDGRSSLRIFIEEHYALGDDEHGQFEALMDRTLSQREWEVCNEFNTDIYRHGLGWMTAADGRTVAVFGEGSSGDGQPIPEKYFPLSDETGRQTGGQEPPPAL